MSSSKSVLPKNTVCPQCGAETSAEMAFCASCGLKLPKAAQPAKLFCPACGTGLTEDMDFCPSCGKKTPKIAAPSKIFCPKCGRQGTTEMTFCASCGTQLPTGLAMSSSSIIPQNDQPRAAYPNTANSPQPQSDTAKVTQALQALKSQEQLGMFAKIPKSSFSSLDYNLSLLYFTQEAELKKLLDSKHQTGGCSLGCSLLFGVITLACLNAFLNDGGDSAIGMFLLCGSICAGAALIAYNSYNFTPPRQISDLEYDDNTLAEMQNLYAACLNELDLDVTEVNEAPPIIFHSYSFEGCTYCKIGADECFRTNIYNVATFLFSANAIHCYQYTYSTTDGTKLKYTNEYFYDDIVSISTGNEIKTINAYQNGMLVNKSIDNQFFSIVTTGGTILTVNLPDKESLESVKAMRSLVKEKKNS